MRKFIVSIAALASILTAQAERIESPSGNVSVDFELSPSGEPVYSMKYNDKEIIKPSKLGYELKGNSNLREGFKLIKISTSSFDETWEPVWGEVKEIRNNYNELLAELEQTSTGRKMNIRFRVYDDGMGLRYEFPQQKNLVYFTVKEEHTQFAMTGDHIAWWIPGD